MEFFKIFFIWPYHNFLKGISTVIMVLFFCQFVAAQTEEERSTHVFEDIRKAIEILPEKMVVSLPTAYLLNYFLKNAVGERTYQDWVGDENTYLEKIKTAGFFKIVILGPLLEEIIRRGPMIPLFNLIGHEPTAIKTFLRNILKISNGIYFGAAHLKNNHPEKIIQAISSGIGGLYYSHLCEQTGGLTASLFAHSATNLIYYLLNEVDNPILNYGVFGGLAALALYQNWEYLSGFFKTGAIQPETYGL